MSIRPFAAAALLLSLAACAWTGPGVPMKLDQATGAAPSREERRAGMGELVYGGPVHLRTSIRFGAWEVDGKRIDVQNMGDGTWVGVVTGYLHGQGSADTFSSSPTMPAINRTIPVQSVTFHTRLRVEPGRIVGDGVTLSIYEEAATGTVTIRGKIGDEKVFVTLTRDEIRTNGVTLKRSAANTWSGPGWDRGEVSLALSGPAADLQRTTPFYLALVDALN